MMHNDVLKSRFYSYHSGYGEASNQEATATEKMSCFSQFHELGEPHSTQGHLGKHLAGQEAEAVRAKHGQEPWLWEGMDEAR